MTQHLNFINKKDDDATRQSEIVLIETRVGARGGVPNQREMGWGSGCWGGFYRSTERESGRIGTRASPSTWNKLEEKRKSMPTTLSLKQSEKKKEILTEICPDDSHFIWDLEKNGYYK